MTKRMKMYWKQKRGLIHHLMLFDLNARDYYNIDNPVVKILLPKMNYEKHERIEVIRQAYKGLFQLTIRGLFDKYVNFIDVYSEISDQEQQQLYETITQHKETAMLAQFSSDLSALNSTFYPQKVHFKSKNFPFLRQ